MIFRKKLFKSHTKVNLIPGANESGNEVNQNQYVVHLYEQSSVARLMGSERGRRGKREVRGR